VTLDLDHRGREEHDKKGNSYLDRYEWQTRRIEERLERAHSGEARWIPHDEVFDRLEAKIKDRIERGQS
jgi:hypothetical protein